MGFNDRARAADGIEAVASQLDEELWTGTTLRRTLRRVARLKFVIKSGSWRGTPERFRGRSEPAADTMVTKAGFEGCPRTTR